MRATRKGVTMLETLLSLMVLSILFGGSFRVLSLQRDLLVTARHTNEAILALESVRNFVLVKIAEKGTVTENDLKQIISKFALAAPITWERRHDVIVNGQKRTLLRFKMKVVAVNRHFARCYMREVILP